jgi:hypothetical protein
MAQYMTLPNSITSLIQYRTPSPSSTVLDRFYSMVLSEPNLIKVKKGTLSSPDLHQNLLIRSNLPWEMGDPREG